MNTFTLPISGMTCANCAARVEKALAGVPGVVSATVNLATEKATVAGKVEAAALTAAVERAGYGVVISELAPPDREPLIVAGGAVLALPLMAAMFLPVPVWLQAVLGTAIQLLLGRHFYVGAFKALRAGAANMDVLVALGTSAAWLYSVWLLSSHGAHAHLYFESAAVVLVLVRLGKWLEHRAKRGAGAAIRALAELHPDIVHEVRDGVEQDLPLGQLQPGVLVAVRPGERIPADGIVESGAGGVDESLLTGESMPQAKQAGDKVIGGALNGTGLLHVRITAVGAETMLAGIVRLVEGAQAAKPPVQKLVDRVSAIFVPVVMVFATLTFLFWWLALGNAEGGLRAAIAVLVIACPCALGLATPAAIVAGTGAAARAGILIRDPAALEAAHGIDTILFDKTGTLTNGRPEVVDVTPHGATTHDELIRLAAAAEQGSEHPLATALRRVAPDNLPALGEFSARPGLGVLAVVGGRRVALGNRALMRETGVDVAPLHAMAGAEEAQGRTVLWLGEAGKLLGFVAVADTPKPHAAEAVAALLADGFDVRLLSGDNRATAEAMGKVLGIEQVIAEVLPADKAATVSRLRREGRRIAMIGDGVNDGPALAAADLGIAMGGGADVAMATAGITLMRGDPRLVRAAIQIGRATRAKIGQNLFWAFFYNVAGLGFAAAGWLTPMLAGGAMALSSVSVLANALLLTRWKPEEKR